MTRWTFIGSNKKPSWFGYRRCCCIQWVLHMLIH